MSVCSRAADVVPEMQSASYRCDTSTTLRVALRDAAPSGMKMTPSNMKIPTAQAGVSTGLQAHISCCVNVEYLCGQPGRRITASRSLAPVQTRVPTRHFQKRGRSSRRLRAAEPECVARASPAFWSRAWSPAPVTRPRGRPPHPPPASLNLGAPAGCWPAKCARSCCHPSPRRIPPRFHGSAS